MISLKTFLEFPFASDIELLYPIAEPEAKYIRSISILEPPVEQFVREDEIIISTALSVRNNDENLFNFINEIYESGAAGLILAFPNDDFTPLLPIQDYFKGRSFPLLTIPWTHLFSDLVEKTLKEIWSEDSSFQNILTAMQNELLAKYINGADFSDAALIIRKYLNCHVIIVNQNGQIKGTSYGLHFHHEHPRYIEETPAFSFSITSGETNYGQLLLYKEKEPVQFTYNLLEQYLLTPLVLWFDKEWSLMDSESHARNDFIWKLAHNSFSSSQELISKAELFKIPTDCKYMCFVGMLVFKSSLISKSTWKDISPYPATPAMNRILQEQIMLSAKDFHLSILSTLHKDTLLIYLEFNIEEQTRYLANDFLDNLQSRLDAALPRHTVIWGYDNESVDITRLSTIYRNAKTTLQMGLKSPNPSLRNCYQLSIKQRIFQILWNEPETVSIAQNTLQHLMDYDEKKQSDLMKTLRTYCDCNYNATQTANILHLHRQSLLYRLEKIESLCNLSLKEHQNLLVLEICMMILE